MTAGHKTGGRKKGTKNKTPRDIKVLAQAYTSKCVLTLVKLLDDPMQAVAAAKVLLAYGHGAPRAAVDIARMSAMYVISDRPLNADEWAAKYVGTTGQLPV
jgi:hypothetical protein